MGSVRTVLALTTLLAVALSAGCAATVRSGSFEPNGFRHRHFEYFVAHDSGGHLVGPGWRLDNFQRDEAGRPTISKVGPSYVRQVRLDVNEDGRLDDAGMAPIYDLLLRNESDAGTIWVRTFPLPSDMGRIDLQVLVGMYVDSIGGSDLRGAAEMRPGGHNAPYRRLATRNVETRPAVIGGREAHIATFEVGNAESVEHSTRWERVQLIVVRPELLWYVASGPSGRYFPALMTIGYSNSAENFDRSLNAFHGLVGRVHFETDAIRQLRERALPCAPDRPLVRVTLLAGSTRAVYSPDADPQCLAGAVRELPLGTVDAWRSFGVLRQPVAAPPPPAPPAASPEVAPAPGDPTMTANPEEEPLWQPPP